MLNIPQNPTDFCFLCKVKLVYFTKSLYYFGLEVQMIFRFRSLKLWFVLRLYGQEGIRAHIRKQVALAHRFEELLLAAGQFKIFVPVTLGTVCFTWNEGNDKTEELFQKVGE